MVKRAFGYGTARLVGCGLKATFSPTFTITKAATGYTLLEK
jgi:hypothetical protein